MSLFCLCVVESIRGNSEFASYMQQIESLAMRHNHGVKFFVDWYEPIVFRIPEEAFLVNILDNPKSDNCELLFLPDGWYNNGETSSLAFRERMNFLLDVTNTFINRKYRVDIYLGQSGTLPEEYSDIILTNKDLVDYLTKTIGVSGINDGVHIGVIP